MLILKVAGGILMLLGACSGIVLLNKPTGTVFADSAATYWLLFITYFIVGLALYSLGAKNLAARNLLLISGGFILTLGAVSAVGILLSKANLLGVNNYVFLWTLFLVFTVIGVSEILMAERYGRHTTPEMRERAAMRNLETGFHRAMISKYRHSPYLVEVKNLGGLAAARKLLHDDDSFPDHKRRVANREADESIETLVLQARWLPLFTKHERKLAESRLPRPGRKCKNSSRIGE